jgi:hypothetical protein
VEILGQDSTQTERVREKWQKPPPNRKEIKQGEMEKRESDRKKEQSTYRSHG